MTDGTQKLLRIFGLLVNKIGNEHGNAILGGKHEVVTINRSYHQLDWQTP